MVQCYKKTDNSIEVWNLRKLKCKNWLVKKKKVGYKNRPEQEAIQQEWSVKSLSPSPGLSKPTSKSIDWKKIG